MTDMLMIICSMLFLLYLSSNQKYILDIEHSNKLMNLSYVWLCMCTLCVCVCVCVSVSVCLCLSVCEASACEVKV